MIIESTSVYPTHRVSMDDIMGLNLLKMIGFPALKSGTIYPDQFALVDKRLVEMLQEEALNKEIRTANSSTENFYLNRMADRLNKVLLDFRKVIHEAEKDNTNITWRST